MTGVLSEQPLEGTGRGVQITAFHGLLCLGQFRLPERVLAGRPAGLGGLGALRALRGLVVGRGQADLLCDLEHLAEPLPDLGLGQGAEEPGHELAADHADYHRDALHL